MVLEKASIASMLTQPDLGHYASDNFNKRSVRYNNLKEHELIFPRGER